MNSCRLSLQTAPGARQEHAGLDEFVGQVHVLAEAVQVGSAAVMISRWRSVIRAVLAQRCDDHIGDVVDGNLAHGAPPPGIW
jgi:hypothetical protein